MKEGDKYIRGCTYTQNIHTKYTVMDNVQNVCKVHVGCGTTWNVQAIADLYHHCYY